MTRYVVHVEDGSDQPDLQGAELPVLAAARREALRFAGALLTASGERFWSTGGRMLTVADAQQLTIFALRLTATDAPAIAGGPAKG